MRGGHIGFLGPGWWGTFWVWISYCSVVNQLVCCVPGHRHVRGLPGLPRRAVWVRSALLHLSGGFTQRGRSHPHQSSSQFQLNPSKFDVCDIEKETLQEATTRDPLVPVQSSCLMMTVSVQAALPLHGQPGGAVRSAS